MPIIKQDLFVHVMLLHFFLIPFPDRLSWSMRRMIRGYYRRFCVLVTLTCSFYFFPDGLYGSERWRKVSLTVKKRSVCVCFFPSFAPYFYILIVSTEARDRKKNVSSVNLLLFFSFVPSISWLSLRQEKEKYVYYKIRSACMLHIFVPF